MRARQIRQGIIAGVLLVIALWLASLIYGLAGKAFIAVREAENARRQYEALQRRRAALEANLAALETARGRDAAIRTAFSVARPGEEVIVVVPQRVATAAPSLPWWEKVWSWF